VFLPVLNFVSRSPNKESASRNIFLCALKAPIFYSLRYFTVIIYVKNRHVLLELKWLVRTHESLYFVRTILKIAHGIEKELFSTNRIDQILFLCSFDKN
jgi:hypothetical protein